MALLVDVNLADIIGPTVVFVFVVPGHQQWRLRSIRANALRAAGGTPGRTYLLTITDGTTIVAQVGAPDAGTDPGTCVVTWANMPGASVAVGADGFTVAPLPNVVLNPGYEIIGAISNGAVGDTWDEAVAWFDFVNTA